MKKLKNNLLIKHVEFNGTSIAYVIINGIHYAAVKQVCTVLMVNYTRSFKNLQKLSIYYGETIKLSVKMDNDIQRRFHLFIPEDLLLKWIMTIKKNDALFNALRDELYDVFFMKFIKN